ncbi:MULTISPECIES: hypothetical protein [Morganellaceae]|uniref:Uncharacterized protein n=3 Tax=Morganellaceae TaxID=1903414 RepID=A0A1B8HCM7_9GAMM|nr:MULTISPECIES: hypothetical protein [Morganellaceae]ELR5071155.1 hypothetical protein [Providencia rettgeri]ELR5204414.1 hypothetical protein [Providencia rettgeri]OBU06837.1 hypothetical protein AYY17_19825 [Morganella psychrotolerans]QCJ72335.1 hypothetical protein C9446_21310 [Providencia heimbachae]UNH28937.1 hypothetical protein MNY64_16940 [Moellerella wisconsensis]
MTIKAVAGLASSLGVSEAEATEFAVTTCNLMLQHPELLAGDILHFAQHRTWLENTDKPLVKGEPETESVLMGMRVLIYKLGKHEGPDGKARQMYDMMRRLGYFSVADCLR